MSVSWKFWKNRKKKPERQKWKPNFFVRILQLLWTLISSAVKVVVGAVATVVLIVMVCVLVFIGILGTYLQDDILPDSDYILGTQELAQTSFMYNLDENGQIELLQQIYTTTDRQWASLDEIPEYLQHAAVAIEDKRFYEHQGVDWITTAKASIKMFFGSGGAGGSTITQQLIKNDSGEDGVTVRRKVREIFRATSLEKNVSKDVIMEWYLNLIYLGEGCFGVKSAAAEYFGKELADLTLAECASLISITNNPSIYDPYSTVVNSKGQDGMARNRDRYEDVLDQMLDQGWITEEEYEEAWNQELVLKRGIDEKYACHECGFEGTASQFDQENKKFYCPQCGSLADNVEESEEGTDFYSWFEEAVLEDVAEDLCAYYGMTWNSSNRKIVMEMIKTGGYHIYTTLDPEVQAQVDLIYEDLEQIPQASSKQQLQSAIVVVDNSTGNIVALAGGVGIKDGFDYWCRATDSTLQTGSSLKPLTVYAPAFEAGLITPATIVDDIPLYYDGGKGYPNNDDYEYTGPQTVYYGITHSVNTIACRVLDTMTTRYSYNYATEYFGLSLLEEEVQSSGQVLTDIGIAQLGMGALSYGLSVEEMTVGFATIANDGVYREGRLYTKVYDSNGNLILDNTQDSWVALSKKAADYMTYCLQNAVENGTGGSAIMYGMSVAGKTGSTSSYRDRWFVGFTPYYTAGVWCGYDEPEAIRGLGYNPAARLWYKVMKPLHDDLPNKSLYDTSEMKNCTICLDCGLLATDACANDVRGNRTTQVKLYREDFPEDECTCHVEVDYCVAGEGVCNEYCHLFEDNEIVKKSLVRMTQEKFEEYLKAETTTLDDSYIYLVDEDGKPVNFTGVDGDLNQGEGVTPYKVCTIHTKELWEATQTPTEPSEPTEPEGTTATVPSETTAATNPTGESGAQG